MWKKAGYQYVQKIKCMYLNVFNIYSDKHCIHSQKWSGWNKRQYERTMAKFSVNYLNFYHHTFKDEYKKIRSSYIVSTLNLFLKNQICK